MKRWDLEEPGDERMDAIVVEEIRSLKGFE